MAEHVSMAVIGLTSHVLSHFYGVELMPKFHFDMPLLLLSSNLPSFLYRSSAPYPRAVAVDTVNKISGCHLQISSVTLWMNTCIRVQNKDCHFQLD